MTSGIDRRGFFSTTAASAAGAWALANSAAWGDEAPSRKVVVGVMGMSRGKHLATVFAKQPGVEVKYVCDVDSKRVEEGVAAVEKAGGKRPTGIGEFQKILDDKEVDALVCAAPNHWHAPATILGVSAGKHVYVEKPCSHNAQEGEWMIAAARKHKKAVQMGSQRRSGPQYIAGIQLIRDGAIGRAYAARAHYTNARPTIGHGVPADVPANLNYDLWQGPAPRTPYLSNRIHYNWHWFWQYGNGELGNNGIHSLDVCRWALGADYPIAVTSSGGRYQFQDDQETPDTHTVCFEFPDRKQITWIGSSCNKHSQPFVEIFGESGTLVFGGSGELTLYDANDKVVRQEKGSQGETEHIANFVSAIRDDKPLACNAEILEGYKSTLLCHLGNISYRVGRSLKCDPQNGHVVNDEQATALWGRQYESGWEPKV
ncbi:MAG TPA: Gfo/Idh/MocA family oxidoreductase [Pirellulales bacterium]